MKFFAAALSALLLFAFASQTANARERRSGLVAGSSIFGTFEGRDRRKLRRLKQRRAQLRRGARNASLRRAKKLRRAKARAAKRTARQRRAARRQARSARRKVARRAPARRVVRRTRTASVARRAKRKPVKKRSANRFARQTVSYRGKQKPGTVVVDTKTRHLYYVLKGRKAIRYGVAVGKQGFAWSGTSRIRRKAKWPTWTPPAEMIDRKPELAKFRAGMPGGPQNPLGARALYLYQGKQDTLYRIHGTNNPASIGSAASSGCIRMRNEDVEHLYARVSMGAKVVVR